MLPLTTGVHAMQLPNKYRRSSRRRVVVFGSRFRSGENYYIAVSNPDMSFLSGGVAKYQGLLQERGLDVEVLQMNANVSVAALAAGNVDYNLILQSVVTANLRGLPLKIAGILIERPNHVVVAHPSIQKFSDLKKQENRD
jgi:hypothetical protein